MSLRTSQSVLHPAQLTGEELLRECVVRHERRRGPGGQHRNKTESAVVLLHAPTGIEGQAAERRSQHDNLRMALKRLRINLALSMRTASLAEASPTALWKSRCHEGRIGCNPDHEDFAPLLAEVLDVLAASGESISDAADRLAITSSQLVKFLKQEPHAFARLNQNRHERGLRKLE